MRGDPWHREPPLTAMTADEVMSLGLALHDCWIDIEGLVPERPEPKRKIVSFRLPLALDSRERSLDDWPWALVIRNPSSLAIEDTELIAIYGLNTIEMVASEVVIHAEPNLVVRIGVKSIDVAAVAASQSSGTL
jgi:hypothetical protein